MHRFCATLLLMILACLTLQGQTATPQPSPSPSPGDSSSKQSQTDSAAPPDASAPDSGSSSSSREKKKKSVVKRKLEDLSPNCVNVGAYEKCRGSKSDAQAKTSPSPAPDSEYANDMDVGDFYFEQKNYMGAMMRFKDALEHKPNDPLATFKLAQALEGLQRIDEARENYSAYIKLEPKGSLVGQAEQALKRLEPANAGKK